MRSVAPTCPRLSSHSLRLVTGLLPSKGRLIHAPAKPGRFTPGPVNPPGGDQAGVIQVAWSHPAPWVPTTAGRPKGVARPGMCRS
jgi:hypothetical protein